MRGRKCRELKARKRVDDYILKNDQLKHKSYKIEKDVSVSIQVVICTSEEEHTIGLISPRKLETDTTISRSFGALVLRLTHCGL